MEDDDIAYIGMRHVWGGTEPFGLSSADRRRHTYVIGKTGSGKTTLLRNLLIQDIAHGRGVGIIDPHGDLAADLLDHIPSWRSDDVIYFDPADRDYPIGTNLLSGTSEENRHLVASGIVSAFKSIWRDSWGPRLEYLLYASVAALAECQNASLLGVSRILVDDRYRAWVLKQVKDPLVRSFWRTEFAGYDKRFLAEIIAPLQNKVGQLLMAPPIRNIVGQVRSKIDFRFMMDDQRIFIANLAKGRLGEDKANLLGALLVTQFQLAAMSRVDIPEDKRCDFHLFVDEFHNFATDSFASILSESRKYSLCLTLSHQYLGQVREEVSKAVFGNVGSIVAFRVGGTDAHFLARDFASEYEPSHFSGLGKHEICVRMPSGTGLDTSFTATTLPPLPVKHGARDAILRRSRERYATRRDVVEGRINRWLRR